MSTFQTFSFPLIVDIKLNFLSNGDINQTTTAKQTYLVNSRISQAGEVKLFQLSLENAGQHTDTLELDSSFNLLGKHGTIQRAAVQLL